MLVAGRPLQHSHTLFLTLCVIYGQVCLYLDAVLRKDSRGSCEKWAGGAKKGGGG